MADITWTDQALDDLSSICLFISRDSSYYARVFANDIFIAAERLEQFPRSGRVVPEVGREDIREILFGDYRIIYRIIPDEVEILTVYHSARLLDSFRPPDKK